MSRWRRPLKAAEVRKILRVLGFELRPLKGTGHEHWVKEGPFRKVTLSAHNEPFDNFIVKSMSDQAGVSVREFYAALES
jgi:predicted RNA binding protein YcfA (HicA-like mRNA interferase family)